eukprot:Sspe_Gene.11926::Locus_4055_Transcript_1_1_Confidence_1.000_Length_2275::g.11926::m.11926
MATEYATMASVKHDRDQKMVVADGGALNVVTADQHRRWMGQKSDKDDELRQQKQKRLTNEMLLDDVKSHEERIHRLHTRIEETACSQQADFQHLHQVGNELLEKQQEGTKWTHLPPLSPEEVIAKAGLSLSWAAIQDLQSQYNNSKNSDHFYNRSLKKLLGHLENGEAAAEDHASNALQKVQEGTNRNADFILTTHELYTLSKRKPVDIQEILEVLKQSDPQIKELKKKFDQITVQRNQALNETEDMQTAEALHNIMDDVLEDLVKIHLGRLSLLLDSAQGESFLNRVDTVAGNVSTLLDDYRRKADEQIQMLTSDIDKLSKEIRECRNDQDQDDLNMQKLQGKCRAALIQNAQKQHQTFENIKKLYADLTFLGDERKGLVDDLIHAKAKFEERMASAEKFQIVAAEHKAVLEDLCKLIAEAQSTYEDVERFEQNTRDKLSAAAEQARKDTEDILLKERRAYYSEFRRYYGTLGELLFAKERRIEEVGDQLESTQHALDMIKTTLDPMKRDYVERIHALERTKQMLEMEVESLRERADQAAEDAEPTEEALLKAGEKIVSPVIELQEINHDKQQQVVAKRKETLEKKKNAVETQELVSASNKQRAKQARATGLSSHMRPLSPERRRDTSSPEERRKSYADKLRKTVEEMSPAKAQPTHLEYH